MKDMQAKNVKQFKNPYDAGDSIDLDRSNSNLVIKMKGTSNQPIETIWEKIFISSLTWDRECHGLYDFDLTKIDKIENKFVGCGYV